MKNITGFSWEKKDREFINLYQGLDKKYHVYTQAAKSLISFSKIKKGETILDLGSGTGILTKQALQKKPTVLYCLDISPVMLQIIKRKMGNKIKLVQADFQKNWHLKEKFSAILSSFTFYYFVPQENKVFRNVYQHLKKGGIFSFNITSYLGEINIGSEKENNFFSIIYQRLDKFLRSKGYSQGWGGMIKPSSILSAQVIKHKLQKQGFKKIHFRFARLPLNPYQAFKFTLDGFYSQGSKPVISKTLYNLPLTVRLKLLKTFLQQNKKFLANFPKVKIIEAKAVK